MESVEYLSFLKSTLVKIENTINLIGQEPPKYIPAYHKVLGIQQKIGGLEEQYRSKLFTQIICVRGIVNYLLNGRYKEAYDKIICLKSDLINICIEIEKNERDRDKEISTEKS